MALLTMARSLRVLAGLAIASTAIAPPASASERPPTADTVLMHGKVLRCLLTFLAGRVVHRADDAPTGKGHLSQ